MDRRDFLKFIGIASVFPAVGIVGTASQRQTDTIVFLGDFPVADSSTMMACGLLCGVSYGKESGSS